MEKKFKTALILAFLIVALIAYIDTAGVNLLGFQEYTSGRFPIEYWFTFRNIALLLMIIVPVCYFTFYRSDKSEALAIFLTSFLLWLGGLADILYFWIQGKAVPQTLIHLNNHIIIGNISKILGFENVTSISLYISVIISIIAVYFISKFLKEKL